MVEFGRWSGFIGSKKSKKISPEVMPRRTTSEGEFKKAKNPSVRYL